MNEVVLLYAGPLGMISHPRITHEVATWLIRLVSEGVEVLIPEIARDSLLRTVHYFHDELRW